jgi:hypothetical protein
MSAELTGTLEVRREHGSDAVVAAWRGLVGNTIAPTVALMASLR